MEDEIKTAKRTKIEYQADTIYTYMIIAIATLVISVYACYFTKTDFLFHLINITSIVALPLLYISCTNINLLKHALINGIALGLAFIYTIGLIIAVYKCIPEKDIYNVAQIIGIFAAIVLSALTGVFQTGQSQRWEIAKERNNHKKIAGILTGLFNCYKYMCVDIKQLIAFDTNFYKVMFNIIPQSTDTAHYEAKEMIDAITFTDTQKELIKQLVHSGFLTITHQDVDKYLVRDKIDRYKLSRMLNQSFDFTNVSYQKIREFFGISEIELDVALDLFGDYPRAMISLSRNSADEINSKFNELLNTIAVNWQTIPSFINQLRKYDWLLFPSNDAINAINDFISAFEQLKKSVMGEAEKICSQARIVNNPKFRFFYENESDDQIQKLISAFKVNDKFRNRFLELEKTFKTSLDRCIRLIPTNQGYFSTFKEDNSIDF